MTPELVFRDPYVVIPAKAGIYKPLWKNNIMFTF